MPRSIQRWLMCTAVVLTCVAGCESDNKGEEVRDKDLERIAKQDRKRSREQDLDRDPDPVVARDRDRAGDRRRGMDEIPEQAKAVDTGDGTTLEYEPARDGVIYVYDADDDQVIYVGRVRERERFRLDPADGRALINSRTVFRSDLAPRHRYRLYFDAAAK